MTDPLIPPDFERDFERDLPDQPENMRLPIIGLVLLALVMLAIGIVAGALIF